MDKIHINGIKIYSYHGAIKEERVLGQYFIIDLVLHLDLSMAARTDDLSQTVHYGEVYELVGKINAQLFDRYAKIVEVETTITKPNPPIDGNYDSVGITLKGKRER